MTETPKTITSVFEVGEVQEMGERPCRTCGRVHARYRPWGEPTRTTWADPWDNHPYYPESWKSIARRLLAERGDSGIRT